MENKEENVPSQHLSDVFTQGFIGDNRNVEIHSECKDKTMRPKSIGGIILKNYKEGEYNGLEEYENE
jgi:hypothetical protein